jgi:hypothetical protein
LGQRLPDRFHPAARTIEADRFDFFRCWQSFVCTACGKRGAEIRPKFSQARMGTG